MCKILLIQNHSIWNFKTIELLYIFVKNGEKVLKLWKMSENWSLGETWSSYNQKCVYSDNPRQINLEQRNEIQ